MPNPPSYQGTKAIDKVRWIEFYNDSGEDIPPFAVMEFRGGLNENGVPKVNKPSSNSQISKIIFNGMITVPTGGFGWGAYETPSWAAYATNESGSGSGSGYDGIPGPGEIWGTEEDDWYLHQDQTGIRIIGTIEDDPFIEDSIYRALVIFDPFGLPDELESGLVSGDSSSHEFIECHPDTGERRTTTFTFPNGTVHISSTPWA